MESSEPSDNFEIAPGYRVCDWKNLFLNKKGASCADWVKAVDIFDKRIRSRFIEPADILIAADCDHDRGKNGFAILAIDFLLIETIQGFKSGCLKHDGKSKDLFKEFLTCWSDFKSCVPEGEKAKDQALNVYRHGRCALHHTGSTDRMLVRKSGDMFVFHEDRQIEINRTLLHKKLTTEFDDYLSKLKESSEIDLRKNFKKKMDTICL